MRNESGGIGSIIAFILSLFIIAGALMWGIPMYRVWTQELSGRAVLAKAEQTRKVLITQAKAEKDAALERAEAIRIVGQAAKDFPEYRTQEFIGAFAEALQEGKISQIIYVPTEANIPILEATRAIKQ